MMIHMGLLVVFRIPEKVSSKQEILAIREPRMVEANFPTSFLMKFLTFLVGVLSSIDPITLIWVSFERPFAPAEIEYK